MLLYFCNLIRKMMKYKIPGVVVLFLLLTLSLNAQDQRQKPNVYQIAGFVITQSGEEDILPVPFANIGIVGTARGTSSGEDGFYSLVVKAGDVLEYSALGYKNVRFVAPDTLIKDFLDVNQVLEKDTLYLPTVTVLPIPSRENFKVEFLAMEVNDELQARALENLKPYAMGILMEGLPISGREASMVYFNQVAIQNYSAGQMKPMPIFNPIAWAKFIKLVKDGKLKKKN